MKLKFRLLLDGSFIYLFFFSKYKVEERFLKTLFCNHAILWAIFGSQIRFWFTISITGAAKKITFFFVNLVQTTFEKKFIIWARFLDSVFEFLIKKKVHYSINNYKILILIFLIFWFRELSILKLSINWDCLIFHKQLGSGFSSKVAYNFMVLAAQSCWMFT